MVLEKRVARLKYSRATGPRLRPAERLSAGQHSVFQHTIGLVGGKDGLQVFVFRGFVFLQKMGGEFFFIGNDQLDHQGGDIVCGIEYGVFFVDFVGTQETDGFS